LADSPVIALPPIACAYSLDTQSKSGAVIDVIDRQEERGLKEARCFWLLVSYYYYNSTAEQKTWY
jgi:hypothetical protein